LIKRQRGSSSDTFFCLNACQKKNKQRNEVDNFESNKEKINKTQKELTFSNEMHIILRKKNKNPKSLEI
jgi:hypothetical protein